MLLNTIAASAQKKTTAKNSVKHKKTLVKKPAKKVVINNPRPDYFEVPNPGYFQPASDIPDSIRIYEYNEISEYAQFPGGMDALYEFIGKNLIYPPSAREASIQGRVIIDFVVEKSGKLSGITLVKGANNDLDKEALRIVSIMPDWIPAEKNHISVRSRYYLPIVFKLGKVE